MRSKRDSQPTERFFVVPPLMLAAALYAIGGLPLLVWGFCVPTTTLAHSPAAAARVG